jgi:hypothetical protein
MPLANRQPADGVAVKADLLQPLGRLGAEVLEGRTLLDAEQRLALAHAERGLGPRAPADRTLHGRARARLVDG